MIVATIFKRKTQYVGCSQYNYIYSKLYNSGFGQLKRSDAPGKNWDVGRKGHPQGRKRKAPGPGSNRTISVKGRGSDRRLSLIFSFISCQFLLAFPTNNVNLINEYISSAIFCLQQIFSWMTIF